jgi:putative membrane protein
MKAILVVIIVVLLVLLAIVVGSRNAEVISVNFLIAQAEMRVSTFMVWSICAGFVLGISTILSKYLALRVRVTLLTRKLNKFAKADA